MAINSIVCFSANDWTDIPSSKFHIMKYLGKHYKVLYVETIGIRNPQLSARDAKRAYSKAHKWLSGLRNVESNIYVWSPLAIPYHGLSIVNKLNSYYVAKEIIKLVGKLQMSNPLVWTYLPNTVGIIEKLGFTRTVYHCIDDYAEFTDVPKAAFRKMEREMLETADVTVVSAKHLYDTKRQFAKSITYVPHGVDVTSFRACLAADVCLSDINNIRKPIAGFVGRIAEWIDLSLIATTATALPNWSFVFIGPSNVDLSPYRGIPNVHFLGKKDFREVPHYIQTFDVCLMPFVDNALVASVNPLKMYEYLAIGKPVVTVPMNEVADFSHVLTVAGRSGFAKGIETAFETDSEAKRQERIESVTGRSWGDVAERILGLLV